MSRIFLMLLVAAVMTVVMAVSAGPAMADSIHLTNHCSGKQNFCKQFIW